MEDESREERERAEADKEAQEEAPEKAPEGGAQEGGARETAQETAGAEGEEGAPPVREEASFECTFTEDRLGLALGNGARGHVNIKRCMPGSVAEKRRLPPGYYLLAVNGESTDQRNLKQVQKMIQIAERPLTLSFSRDPPP